MMLTHILTVCHTTAFPVLRKESKKRKRVTYVKRETAMVGVFAGKALAGTI